MPPDPWINTLLARQDGLLGLHQAVAHGICARTVQRRARSGEWQRLAPLERATRADTA